MRSRSGASFTAPARHLRQRLAARLHFALAQVVRQAGCVALAAHGDHALGHQMLGQAQHLCASSAEKPPMACVARPMAWASSAR